MRSRTTSSVADYRRRMARRGYVRVEVQVRREDASLVRGVAAALADPAREADARRLLRQRFGPARAGLKALLAAAPLDDVELDRPRDTGREIDL